MALGDAALVFVLALAPGELRWTAPDGCPSEAEVTKLIEQEVDFDATLETIAIVTENDDGTWTLAIEIRRGDDELEREIELDSCEAAAEAVALVYALALTRNEEATPAPEPEDVVPKVVAQPPSPTRTEPADVAVHEAAPPPPRRPPRFALHVGGGGGVGTLGRGGGHVLAGLGVVWPWVRLGARVDHSIVRHIEVDDVSANISSTTGGIDLAIPIPVGPVELLPGIDVRAGAVRARGGGDSGRVAWVPWVLAGAGLSLVWMRSWWGLRVGAELEVPLLRHTFTFDALEVARTQRVGALFWAGPEIRLPAPR